MSRSTEQPLLPMNHPLQQHLSTYAHWVYGQSVAWDAESMRGYMETPGRAWAWEWRVAQGLRILEARLAAE